ncbi:MAG TPA: PilZ domain-containing protein [Myxococcaceae bacterium]|nr:PilZ domain-containing protein [Myxococcaceae bacterium]
MAKANETRSRSRAVSTGPAAREGLSTALHRPDLVGPKIELDTQDDGPEHRAFPRAKLAVPFGLWIGDGDSRRFSATLVSVNVSVSGAFLKSSFFLPVGTQMSVRFQVEATGPAVEARVEVLRQETEADRTGRTGMGLRFLEFFRQTEVTLARLFLGEQLRKFAEGYLASTRARSLSSELDRVVDALAAWELLKVTSPNDPWRFAK